MHPGELSIKDFQYTLPEDHIARYPLERRDQSRLLVFNNGVISSSTFDQIGNLLSDQYLLIGNNTRVIPARLLFHKTTGGVIEIFCLEPADKRSHQDAMYARGSATWICMVGGARKWKDGTALHMSMKVNSDEVVLSASILSRHEGTFRIEFQWPGDHTFSEILEHAGLLPLPPYFNREAEQSDYERYQTVFAQHKGSVAAPTAGLHFTPEIIDQLKTDGIAFEEITLHVGAGTFKPVSAANMRDHEMHSESFSVSLSLLRLLVSLRDKKIVAVGTTSMRCLESLYWLGIKIQNGDRSMRIDQWDPYASEGNADTDTSTSISALIQYCETNNMESIQASTSIMIAPGYQFRLCNGLITNFHLPQSTLLLLVAALTGTDAQGNPQWKNIYDYALTNGYRFLSYGDSSLLLP